MVSQQQTHEHANHTGSNDDNRDLSHPAPREYWNGLRYIELEMSPLGPGDGNGIIYLSCCHGIL